MLRKNRKFPYPSLENREKFNILHGRDNCYENNSLFFCLLQRFALNKHLQVIFSTEKHDFAKVHKRM